MKAIVSVVIVAAVTGLVGARWYCCRAQPAEVPHAAGHPRRSGGRSHRHGTASSRWKRSTSAPDRRHHQGIGPGRGPARQDRGLSLPGEGGRCWRSSTICPTGPKWTRPRAALKLAEAEFNHFRVRQKQTERDFERAKQLKETDSAAQYENAQAEMEIAKADLAMSEAKVEQAKIAMKQAEINLGYTTITAPVDGMVIDRNVNIGQTVVAGMNAPSLFLLARDLGPHAGLGRRERGRHRRRAESGRR